MKEFLNSFLQYAGEEPIDEILSMRSEYPVMGDSADQKNGRLDVRVKSESGRLFDVEVQVEKDYMNERSFFYGSRMGEDEFPPGTPYNKMPEVRIINLVDFYMRDDRSYLVEPVVLSYLNNPGELATEKIKIYYIQMPTFRREHKTLESVKGNLFFTWLYLFDRGYQNPEEMEVISRMTEGLMNFAKRYNYSIDDPDLIRRYRMIEDGKRDIATKISAAVEKAERETAKRVELETAQRVERETAQRVERETARRVERETTQRVKLETIQEIEDQLEHIMRVKGLDEDQIAEYTRFLKEKAEEPQNQ